MAYPYGNQSNKKLDTPELRQEAYKQYCAHLAKGKSKRSWFFDHPELTLTWETMEKYIRLDVGEFDPEHKKISECQGFAVWEKIVEDSARGDNKDANTASLQMLMRNKYGWDKREQNLEDTDGSLLEAQELVMKQLANYQSLSSHAPKHEA